MTVIPTRALRVRLYGDASVMLPDGRSVALERRAAALLALAALEPGITRLRAATLLWPDSGDPRRNLRQQLLRFRQHFGQALVEGGATLSFTALELEAPDEAATPSAQLLHGLDYEDCEDFAAWLQAQRRARHERRAKALDEALSRAESEQRYGDAVALAEQMLVHAPEAEAHHRTLIRLHYLNQDTARARAAFDALQRLLEVELGARPSAETLALMRLLDQPAAQALAPAHVWATALQRPPRMVGRRHELQALRQALADRRALLLRGEAGMGKSRLLAEGLEGAAGQVLVKAQAGDAGVPYATLARLLRRLLEQQRVRPEPGALARLLPEIGAVGPAAAVPLPADGERLMLQAAVERVLVQARLQVVAVDDLHFADDASLEMLTALASAEALSPLAWLFTQRPGEGSAAANALRDVLEEAQRLDVTDVAPLDGAQMIELVRSLCLPDVDADAVGQRLLRHTGGNPLFALETLKQMLLPGAHAKGLPQPASVGALIDRRLRQLSEGALALARVAAIAGPDFGPALAEDVLGRRAIDLADAWTELEQAQVLRERALAHDLVLEATLRSVPQAIAEHLHAAMARHLEGRHGEPARLAGHWLAAGDERRALPWLVKAADQARDGLRRREEAEFLERAARIAANQDPALAPSAHGLWLRAHQALECVDGELGAMRALDQALAHACSPRDRLQVLAMRVSAQVKQIDLTAAVADGREALHLAAALGDDGMTAAVLMPLAIALSTSGQGTEAGRLLDAHWPAVERLAQPEPTTFIEHGVVLDILGRPLEARASHRRGIELALRHKQHSEFVMGSKNLAVNHIDTGELEAAMSLLDAAERERRAHDALQGINHLSWNLQAMALRDLGRYAESLERFDLSLAVTAEQLPARLPLDRLHRAWLWAWIGQWARAQQDLAAHDDYGVLPAWVQARALQLKGRLAQWQGLPLGDLPERARAAVGDGALHIVHDSIEIDAALARGLQSPAAAATSYGSVLGLHDRAQRDGYSGARWAAALACARLAARAGEPEVARAHVQACLRRPVAEVPLDCAPGHWWHALWRSSQQLRDTALADSTRAEGVAWIHRTLHHGLSNEFQPSFRHAVPAHRELLAG
ncbi:MAG: AAA family ATPase [Rubrivivax sp.]|nr:AAA family ATPase [Rubrivivax sp.]